MSMSLREQLLKAGLVTEKQARQAERQQKQQQWQQPKQARGAPKPPAPAASQQAAAKAARDQELNRKQQEKAAARARVAQVRQLVEQYRVPRIESDDYYNFVDGGKVRRIPVDASLRRRILEGELLIARCEGKYDLVPADAAARIRERDASAVLPPPASTGDEPAPDDPYKDFVIPDDLTW
ncbi:MAG: DUF2058 domain-containing protein [Gammaproteobacteria bacterium]|nr:DUF2058 domain-containing protein [Gammaproteobacteria bacterium]